LLATHSTEIITEAETDDILLVNKNHQSAHRIRDPSQLEQVFRVLGSNINPILTQLAKTRRALFVEGKDFQILGKFARKVGATGVGNRRDFAVVPVEGFNPERIRNLKTGMETTLGTKIVAAAILDRDYRSDDECKAVAEECKAFCNYVAVHKRKEIENFLLVPDAIDRALASKVADQVRRSGAGSAYQPSAEESLLTFSESKKSYVASRTLAERRRFERAHAPGQHEASVDEVALDAFEKQWADPELRLCLVPGKDALGWVNRNAQERYGVSVTATAIIDAMHADEIPAEMRALVEMLSEFSAHDPRE
jgi:hypothetical protein